MTDATSLTPAHGERLVVVGQGYVGLPLAVRAVEAGFDLVGYEVDPSPINPQGAGDSPVEDIADERLAAVLASGRYRPSHDPDDLAGFDIAVISVPTPLREGSPDLSFVEQAALTLGPHLQSGACVVLESTTYPGTTEEVVAPILEDASGLVAGEGFDLGYSPERIDPGNSQWRLENTPKVVSGVTPRSCERVQGVYGRLVETTVAVSTTREAELTKLLENTFRHVNIALVNELAMFAHALDIDIWEAIDAASTKPFGFMPFRPGPGVGGHCLPIDPSYLSWQVKRTTGQSFRFVELANDVNEHMPDYVVSRAIEHLNDRGLAVRGRRILLLGVAYKRNTGDARETPAVPIARRLVELGAELWAADPHVADEHLPAGARRVSCDRDALAAAELVIVLVDHDDFDPDLVAASGTPVLDCRRWLPAGPTVEHL